jgi:DNA-directed RNA polymerase subunit RPC12/RpoP
VLGGTKDKASVLRPLFFNPKNNKGNMKMSIKFECPKCKKQLEAENDHVGMRLDCPQCNEEITVPKPTLKVSNQEANANPPPILKAENPEGNTNPVGLFDFKNASPQKLNAAYNAIANRTNEFQRFLAFIFGRKKEFTYLPQILLPNEQILAFVSGRMPGKVGGPLNGKNTMMGGLLVLTEKRIIFISKIPISGLKQIAVTLDKVNSITGQTGLIFGEITITEAAGSRIFDCVDKKGVFAFVEIAQNTMAGHYQQYFYGQSNESNPDLKMAHQGEAKQADNVSSSKNKKAYKKWGCGCLIVFILMVIIGSFAKKDSAESWSSSKDAARNNAKAEQPQQIINSNARTEQPKKTMLQMWSEFKPEQRKDGGWSCLVTGIPLVKGYAERFPQFDLIKNQFDVSGACYLHGGVDAYFESENILVKQTLVFLVWDGKCPTYLMDVVINDVRLGKSFIYGFICDSATGKIQKLTHKNERTIDYDNILELEQKFNK